MALLEFIGGMSKEKIENITKSNSNFAPSFVNHHVLLDLNFSGYCLIKNNIYIPKKLTNILISYVLNPWLKNLNTDFIWILFGSVKLTDNADLDKCKYSSYNIGFDSRSEFTEGSVAKSVIIFEADMSSSVHIDNENKGIWWMINARIR